MRRAIGLALASLALGCSGSAPSISPLPARLNVAGDPLFPSSVKELTIEHGGCNGRCPIYRVTLANDGRFRYEGTRFVRDLGVFDGVADPADTHAVFSWLQEHPGVRVAPPQDSLVADLDVATFGFTMKTGESIRFRSRDSQGDLWVLSLLVDGMVDRVRRSDEPEH